MAGVNQPRTHAFPDMLEAKETMEALIDRVVPAQHRRELRIAISRFAEDRYEAGHQAGQDFAIENQAECFGVRR